MTISLHIDPDIVVDACKAELMPLVRIVLPDILEDVRSRACRNVLPNHVIVRCDDLASADLVVIPVSWQHVMKRRLDKRVQEILSEARHLGKPVISWTSGDSGYTPPFDVHVYRAAAYRSRMQKQQHIMPFMLTDPVHAIMKREDILPREWRERPLVGFCGQANPAPWKTALDITRVMLRNTRTRMGLRLDDPEALLAPSRLRTRVLDSLERAIGVDTCFIRRSRYRGSPDLEERRRMTYDFYENIDGTDYTVCMRGGGNFSVRLYETLAMGRIPLFIDTDCRLPFDDEIDWRSIVVWIDEKDIASVGEILQVAHHDMGPRGFEERQMICRRFWLETLTPAFYWDKQLTMLTAMSQSAGNLS